MSNKNKKTGEPLPRLSDRTRHGIFSVACIALAFFLVLAGFGSAGIAGEKTYGILSLVFGKGYLLFPFAFLLLGVSFLQQERTHFVRTKGLGVLLFFLSSLGLVELLFQDNTGGAVGVWIATPLLKLFDLWASVLFLLALIVISLLVLFDAELIVDFSFLRHLFARKKAETEMPAQEQEEDASEEEIPEEPTEETEEVSEAYVPVPRTEPKERKTEPLAPRRKLNFTPPPLSLLEGDSGKPGVGDIKANANIIKRTLANFGIDVEMDEISIGPTITRYALKPAEGVKLSKIVSLQNDLSLALAAHPIRIEAPIPGKSLVGIEIPNTTKALVGLGSILSSPDYQNSPHPLLFALGRGTSGSIHFANLAKAPHLLIAGATGSGKSVTIHSVIASLLYRNSPEHLRFIMIDPKRVELTLYNKIPHLLTPVITDPKKAIFALKWAVKEMERRYNVLEAEAVRDIQSFHASSAHNHEEAAAEMPYLVIIIDELADMMSTFPREFEAVIVRLAQMSRAVGIHLILSTQRPSVEVITGLIKANIPARIAFQVPSQIDSRTIIDMPGAEKLLGAGDMLYLGGDMSKPQRIQSAFISETEVKKVVKFLTDQYDDLPPSDIDIPLGTPISGETGGFGLEGENGGEDDLYEEARRIVTESKKASTSYLQRRLKIGYARAARLIDMLEERGVVGPGEGAKPRDVLAAENSSLPHETPAE